MSDIIVTSTELPQIPGLRLSQVSVPSSLDGAAQPIIIGVPETPCATPTPLLVGLHTWSADVRQQTQALGPLCAQCGWLMVLPNFRGPNLTSNPEAHLAGGSPAAQRDIADAVAYMRAEHEVDARRIYLIGGSGGGHMSLLMAGKYPDLWAGVSAWCPISSLREWHEQGNSYAPHVEAVCGGAPGASAEVDFEYERRSPRTFITNAASTHVRISHGDKDRCIYVAQTWRTYEKLLDLPHRVEFYSWNGGHEIINEWGFAWLSQQVKPTEAPPRLDLVSDEGKWYFWLYLEPDAPLSLAQVHANWVADHTLELTIEHSAVTRVNPAGFVTGKLTGVEHGGQPVPLSVVECAEGLLTLPACSTATPWRLTFG